MCRLHSNAFYLCEKGKRKRNKFSLRAAPHKRGGAISGSSRVVPRRVYELCIWPCWDWLRPPGVWGLNLSSLTAPAYPLSSVGSGFFYQYCTVLCWLHQHFWKRIMSTTCYVHCTYISAAASRRGTQLSTLLAPPHAYQLHLAADIAAATIITFALANTSAVAVGHGPNLPRQHYQTALDPAWHQSSNQRRKQLLPNIIHDSEFIGFCTNLIFYYVELRLFVSEHLIHHTLCSCRSPSNNYIFPCKWFYLPTCTYSTYRYMRDFSFFSFLLICKGEIFANLFSMNTPFFLIAFSPLHCAWLLQHRSDSGLVLGPLHW